MDDIPPDWSDADLLPQALAVVRPLAQWLVRSGVGYAAFAAALKPVFLAAAEAEARRHGQRPTDSALSLLSGLHRKDVKQLRADAPETPLDDGRPRPARATPAQQVVTRWLASGLPDALPLAGEGDTFEALARRVSTDVHPRSLAQELVRLGVASEAGDQLVLRRQAFVPDARHREARQLLADSVADHLAAGVHNLSGDGPVKYLDQSVFADGLSEDSVRTLERLANRLWADVLSAMVAAAVPLADQDEAAGGTHRLRLGMFCYSTRMAPVAAANDDNAAQEPAP